MLSRWLLFLLRQAGLEELLLLLLPDLPIFLELYVLFDCLWPFVVEVAPAFFLELLDDIALLHFQLYALALHHLEFLLELLIGLADLDAMQYFNFLEVFDPADDEIIGVSLEVEEDLQLLLQLVLQRVDAVDLELLVQHLLHEGVVGEDLLEVLLGGWGEIEDHDEGWVLFLPGPLEHLAEVADRVLEVDSLVDAPLKILLEGVVLVSFEKLGD